MRALFLIAVAGLAVAGCDTNKDQKASAQEAGAAVDRAVDDAGHEMKEVGQDLDRAGEKAEAQAKEAGQDVKEVGRDVKQGVNEGLDKAERAADAAGNELKKDN